MTCQAPFNVTIISEGCDGTSIMSYGLVIQDYTKPAAMQAT